MGQRHDHRAPLYDDTGVLKGLAKITRDFTQRGQLERVAAQAEALTELTARDQFLGMLSHELRNPLAPQQNAAELQRR